MLQICTLSVSFTLVKLEYILQDEGKLSTTHIILSMNCTVLKAAIPKALILSHPDTIFPQSSSAFRLSLTFCYDRDSYQLTYCCA